MNDRWHTYVRTDTLDMEVSLIGSISVHAPGPTWLLVVGTVAMLGRVAAAVAEHSLAGVSLDMSAIQAASERRSGQVLHRAIAAGSWLAGTTSIRTSTQSVETAAFALCGASIWGTAGFFGAIGVQATFSSIFETAAKRWATAHKVMIASKVATLMRAKLRAGIEEDLDPSTVQIINSALALRGIHVKDVMIPLADVISIEHDATVLEALDILLQHRLSRAPIIEKHSVGVVHIKDLAVAARKGDIRLAKSHARDCTVVPEGKPLDAMLRYMQHSRTHLVAVADEYGSVSGVVSLEDCIEAVLGKIDDEHDEGGPSIRIDGVGKHIAAGDTSVALVNQTLGSTFTESAETTIGGLVFGAVGQSAEVGDTVHLNGWTITVLSTRRRRILSVSLEYRNVDVPTRPSFGPKPK